MGLGLTRISVEGYRWITTNAVLLAFAAIAVVLRLYARELRGKPLAFNDYAIVLSLVFTAGFSAVEIIAATHGGVGFDMVEVLETMGYDAIVIMLKCMLASEVLYPLAMGLVKLSILHFYVTIFPNPVFHIFAYVTMGLTVAYSIATILDTFLGCRPLEYSWNKQIAGGTCGNELLAYMMPSIINVIIDVVVIILPLPILWTLKMRLPRKIAISLIFSMGIVVCVVSGIRLNAVYSLDVQNITSTVGDLGFWTALEPLLGIINACLPMLQPIFKAPFARVHAWWANNIADGEKRADDPGSDERPLQPSDTTLSTGSRLFRRLYGHLYPLSDVSRDETSGFDRDAQASRDEAVWDGRGAQAVARHGR